MCVLLRRRQAICMHQNNSQLYSRKEIKTLLLRLKKKWLDLELPNFFFPLKYHLTTLERQLNYLKCFTTMSLWPFNDLRTTLCHQGFLVQCLFSTYWKLLEFLESIWSVFNSKAVSRVPLIIFIALMVSRAWQWLFGKWVCDSISSILAATPVLAPTVFDVPSLH